MPRPGNLLFVTLLGLCGVASVAEVACSQPGGCSEEAAGRSLLQQTSSQEAQDLLAAEKEEEDLQKEEEQRLQAEDDEERREEEDVEEVEAGDNQDQKRDGELDGASEEQKPKDQKSHCLCGKGEFVPDNKLWGRLKCQDRMARYCKRKQAPSWMKRKCCDYTSTCDLPSKAKSVCAGGNFVGKNKLYSRTTCQNRLERSCESPTRWSNCMKRKCCDFTSTCDLPQKAKSVCAGGNFVGKNKLYSRTTCQNRLEQSCASPTRWANWMKSKCCDFKCGASEGAKVCGGQKFLGTNIMWGRVSCQHRLDSTCKPWLKKRPWSNWMKSKCCDYPGSDGSCLCGQGSQFIGSKKIYGRKCEDRLASVCTGSWSRSKNLVKRAAKACCLPATTTTIITTTTTTTTTTTPTTTTTTLHPCDDDSHGCDDNFGICVKQNSGWSCDCASGYECVAGCDDPNLPHQCAVITTTTTTTATTTTTIKTTTTTTTVEDTVTVVEGVIPMSAFQNAWAKLQDPTVGDQIQEAVLRVIASTVGHGVTSDMVRAELVMGTSLIQSAQSVSFGIKYGILIPDSADPGDLQTAMAGATVSQVTGLLNHELQTNGINASEFGLTVEGPPSAKVVKKKIDDDDSQYGGGDDDSQYGGGDDDSQSGGGDNDDNQGGGDDDGSQFGEGSNDEGEGGEDESSEEHEHEGEDEGEGE